jgi:indole-3-glycerol phosphate synthase
MSTEDTYLDKIVAAKRAELSRAPAPNLSDREIAAQLRTCPPALDFLAALLQGPAPRAIAEIKRASPSAGPIRPGADARHIAALYVDAGAACLSVVTDARFDGSVEDLRRVRASVSVPLLRKDFVLQRSQVLEARREGADAVLLIAAILDPPLLRELVAFCGEVGLVPFCEAHDEREVERALAAGARLVGVNNRDLRTFEVDLSRSIRLRSLVPRRGYAYVAESGIRTREDVGRLREAGVDAFLVSTQLMQAEDPGLALLDLLGG